MLKISAFYFEKQKCFIPKKKLSDAVNIKTKKKALFTDPIFSEGFAVSIVVAAGY